MSPRINFGSIACLLVGMAIGFYIAKMSDVGTSTASSVAVAIDRSGMLLHDFTNSSRPISQPQHTYNNFIEEYIPSILMGIYQQHHFQFNLTKSMLRKSRPIVGNTQRLHSYLRKLQSQQCTTVLILGGSISAGHHVTNPDAKAYPARLVEWLNKRYPCKEKLKDGNSISGKHQYKKIHAQNSQTHMIAWSTIENIESFDMVIFEFNVNDHFIPDLSHALEDKGAMADVKEYRSLWYFEVLLRRLLLIRKPDPPAVITFNADYLGRTWADKPWYDPEEARKTLFRSNQEPVKLWLSSMYEIPVFSASIWMLPLSGKLGGVKQFDPNGTYPYATDKWHTDACCHPRAEGHLILGLVLAYCLVEEEKVMNVEGGESMLDVEADFTALETPLLRDPIYLSSEEEDLYVQNNLAHSFSLDFTNPSDGEEAWKDAILNNNGWTWYADNNEQDKFGYIADNVDGGQHISIALTGGHIGVVEVSYVVSYENFGTALAWLDDESENNKQKDCNKPIDNWKRARGKKPHILFASWEEQASVPKVDVLPKKLEEGKEGVLHICLTPKSEKVLGLGNRFKLLTIRVY